MAPRAPYRVGESFNTTLSPLEEMAFRQWVKNNNVPFNPDESVSDYDMRGFYRAQQQGSPLAQSGVNPTDNQLHYTDYFKTPIHRSFSSESQWAGNDAPQWINETQLAEPNGRIVFDEAKIQKSNGGKVMPLTKSGSKEAFKSNIKAEMAAGKPQRQSVAIAYRVQRDAMKKAGGGGISAPPFWARSEAKGLERSGFIPGMSGGRSDTVPTRVKNNSYIIPADIVSGIGHGNSLAGANALNRLLKMGPYGSTPAPIGRAMTPKMPKMKFADGGVPGMDQSAMGQPSTDVVVSDGEFAVPPDRVMEIGGGDIKHGHEVLDKLVHHVRKKTIKTLSRLPKPKRN